MPCPVACTLVRGLPAFRQKFFRSPVSTQKTDSPVVSRQACERKRLFLTVMGRRRGTRQSGGPPRLISRAVRGCRPHVGAMIGRSPARSLFRKSRAGIGPSLGGGCDDRGHRWSATSRDCPAAAWALSAAAAGRRHPSEGRVGFTIGRGAYRLGCQAAPRCLTTPAGRLFQARSVTTLLSRPSISANKCSLQRTNAAATARS